MRLVRLPSLLLVTIAAALGCSGSSIDSPNASALLVTSKTSLVVGDTMLVKAGLRSAAGEFTEFPAYTVSVRDTVSATVVQGTHVVRAKAPGEATVQVRVAIAGQGTIAIDSVYPISGSRQR